MNKDEKEGCFCVYSEKGSGGNKARENKDYRVK